MSPYLSTILIGFCCFCFSLTCLSQSSKPLFEAIRNNDVAQVRSLIAGGADINSRDEDSDNVFMYAALYSSPETMQMLLQKGVDINARNKSGETALMWCMHDRKKIDLLLKNGADINVVANSGNTPLFVACVGSDQYDIVRTLLDKGANPLARSNKKETVLMRAAMFGDTSTVSLLLQKGIDVNAQDQDGMTALMHAVLNSNRPVALQLIEHGADPDIFMSAGISSLDFAVIYNDEQIVKAMLGKTRNVNRVTAGGYSPLMWATYNEYDNTKIVKALLDKGADVNFKSSDGSTALSWAQKKGKTATVVLLTQAGAK